MSGGSTKLPKAPDPVLMAELSRQANQVGQSGPGGTTSFSQDENGNSTQTQTLSPGMQTVYDRMMGLAGKDPEMASNYDLPEGFGGLQSAIGNKVGERYGMKKPQEQTPQSPQGMNNNAAMQQMGMNQSMMAQKPRMLGG
jgi:hypothetical protein